MGKSHPLVSDRYTLYGYIIVRCKAVTVIIASNTLTCTVTVDRVVSSEIGDVILRFHPQYFRIYGR